MSNPSKDVVDNKKTVASHSDRDEPVALEPFVRAVSSDEDDFARLPGSDDAGSERLQNTNQADSSLSSDDSEESDLSDDSEDSEDDEAPRNYNDLLRFSSKEVTREMGPMEQAEREAAVALVGKLAVQKKIGELEQQLKSLKVDEESLVQRKSMTYQQTYQQLLQEKDEKIVRLTKKNKKLERSCDDAWEQVWSLERQLKYLEADSATIESLKSAIEKQSADFAAMKSAWHVDQKAFHFGKTMSDKYWTLVEEEKKWIAEVERLASLIEEQGKESDEKNQQIRYLEKKCQILQEKVDEGKGQEVEAKKEDEGEVREDYKSMEIRQLEAALCVQEQQLKMLREDLSSSEGRCFRKDQVIKELKKKSSELQTQKKDSDDKWRMKMEESKAEIERLEKTVRGYKHHANVEMMDSKNGWSRIPKLQETIQKQADEIQVLKKEISMGAGEKQDEQRLTHEIAVKAQRIFALENELAELKDQDTHMEAQILGLTADYEEQKELVKSLKKEMVDSINRSTSEMALKEEALKDVEAKVRRQEQKIKDQGAELCRRTVTISRLQSEADRSQSGRTFGRGFNDTETLNRFMGGATSSGRDRYTRPDSHGDYGYGTSGRGYGGFPARRGYYEPENQRDGFSFNPRRHTAFEDFSNARFLNGNGRGERGSGY